MTRDDIVKWAQEAAIMPPDWGATENQWRSLEAFAKLVAAAEREKWKWEELHTCHPHCDRPACVAVRRAREDEREACANLVEQAGVDGYGTLVAALLIRERGAP